MRNVVFLKKKWRSKISADIINEVPFFSNEMENAKLYYNYSLTLGVKSLEKNLAPTFRQFSEFLVKRGLNFGRDYYGSIVEHWVPYFISCNPCNTGTYNHLPGLCTALRLGDLFTSVKGNPT